MKPGSSASFRAAAEIGDYEELEYEEITDWSECPIHGKYPTEFTEIVDDGLRICPLCYIDEMKKRKSIGKQIKRT